VADWEKKALVLGFPAAARGFIGGKLGFGLGAGRGHCTDVEEQWRALGTGSRTRGTHQAAMRRGVRVREHARAVKSEAGESGAAASARCRGAGADDASAAGGVGADGGKWRGEVEKEEKQGRKGKLQVG
jgi:hypothetical protein